MELNIDRIEVTVENVSAYENDIAGEVERCIRLACLQLLQSDIPPVFTGNEVFRIVLPEIDWEDETDKAGRIAQMLRDRIFCGEEGL